MKNMTLEQIAGACGGTYVGSEADKKKEISGAVIDSRLVEPGYLFIPIKGAKVDGHRFIPDVFTKGALAVLSEQKLENPAGPYILVASTEAAMKRIAAYYRRTLDIKVVGITGSVGKTSTKEMIASVLSQKYNVLKTEGNLNNEIGLPLTIFKIRQQHEIAVLEMGISEFGEMHRLSEMAYPDICVITNIGTCHLENLHTRDGILQAKTECFSHMKENGIAVLNGDDDKLCTKKSVNGKPAVFYGMGKKVAVVDTETGEESFPEKSIYATDVEVMGLTGTKAVIHIETEKKSPEVPADREEPYSPQGVKEQNQAESESMEITFPVEIPIAGEHNVYNALAATAVAVRLGLNAEEIRRGIETVQTIGGRSNLIHKDGITVIDDCYNANPVSMKASVDVLSKAPGRKLAVLGDMGELGSEERQLHYSVGEHFKGKNIDILFCTGVLSKEIINAVQVNSPKTEIRYMESKEALIEEIKKCRKAGDTILVKASHFMGFSDIVSCITK
ncbi:MAG: UDP-N-acetylmuramoyl-tripeptide--D-alanyl-D-alanine ligase [Roseburia sp.]|nr:UDP-N-acetylmuramoyl-tripeptide--D-alanyl-D-alanine ligase [Roseburia sp.]